MTSKREQLLQIIERDVEQDCSEYQDLQNLMQALYQQLLQRDSRQIELLNVQIGTLIEQVRCRAQRRSKILGAFALGSGSDALQRLSALLPGERAAGLTQAWQQLGQQAARCKQLNERNGRLLAMHNDILSQLLGESREPHLYTAQFY